MKSIFKKLKLKYYMLMCRICYVSYEQAHQDAKDEDAAYWVKRYNKYISKYDQCKNS